MHIIANEMIPVYDNDGNQAVNTRELHEGLQVGTKYADWIRDRISKLGLVEGEDYQTFSENTEKGRPTVDYIVPIDIAKEIAMMENNDKGRQVRRYFIEVEKRYRLQAKPMTTAEMLAAQAQVMVDLERRQAAVEATSAATVETVKRMAEAVTSPLTDGWKDAMNKRINDLCMTYGLSYQALRGDMYARLEDRMHCNLAARISRKQARMKQAGFKCAEQRAVTKLDVIADDRGLRAAFETIVRQVQFRCHASGVAAHA